MSACYFNVSTRSSNNNNRNTDKSSKKLRFILFSAEYNICSRIHNDVCCFIKIKCCFNFAPRRNLSWWGVDCNKCRFNVEYCPARSLSRWKCKSTFAYFTGVSNDSGDTLLLAYSKPLENYALCIVGFSSLTCVGGPLLFSFCINRFLFISVCFSLLSFLALSSCPVTQISFDLYNWKCVLSLLLPFLWRFPQIRNYFHILMSSSMPCSSFYWKFSHALFGLI